MDLLLTSAAEPQIETGTILQALTGNPPQHFATSHDDTSQGAVHVITDEHGYPITYVFDEKVQSNFCAALHP